MKTQQITDTLLMIRPLRFGFNTQTAASNAFQQPALSGEGQQEALAEFERVAERLRAEQVRIIAFDDTPEPPKTDAVFPNNWISTHADGTLITYPMMAPGRRAERRADVVRWLRESLGFDKPLDLSPYEQKGLYLEGTGSLVLDRVHRLAYAAISPRTDPGLVKVFCDRMGYRPVLFHAADAGGRTIYHTNVVMMLGETFGACCFEAMQAGERKWVAHRLVESGRAIVELSMDQLSAFAGNMLQVFNAKGERLILCSRKAADALTPRQVQLLERHGRLLPMAIPVIERLGGGSIRCMLAEIFPPAT